MQGSLAFHHTVEEISDEAIKLCVEVSGMCVKEVAFNLDREEKWLSRVLADNPDDHRHFPPDLLNNIMNICDNEIPLRWLSLSRGYGLHRLKSELERENDDLKSRLVEQEQRLATITDFIKQVKGGL
jgi:hypothetical protein